MAMSVVRLRNRIWGVQVMCESQYFTHFPRLTKIPLVILMIFVIYGFYFIFLVIFIDILLITLTFKCP